MAWTRSKPYHALVIRSKGRPSPRFRGWVQRYGVSRLARSLGTTRSAVNSWMRATGQRVHVPDLPMVQRMLALSALEPLHLGPLTYEDVLGSYEVVSQRVIEAAPKRVICQPGKVEGAR